MIAKNLSYQEIKKYTSKLAILPVGSTEQHGPYLPLATDAISAEQTAWAVEKLMSKEVVVFPTLYFGCAKEHRNFPGTVYLEFETYMRLIREIARSIFEAGFDKLLIINGHGGNHQILQVIQADWNYDHPDKKLYYHFAFTDGVKVKAGELFGHMESHAGSSETSLIYSFSPEYVKTKDQKSESQDYLRKPNTSLSTHLTDEISPVGVVTKSTVLEFDSDKGRQIFKVMAKDATDLAKKILETK